MENKINEIDAEIIRLEREKLSKDAMYNSLIANTKEQFVADCIQHRKNAELGGINKRINQLYRQRKKEKQNLHKNLLNRQESIKRSKLQKIDKLMSKFETFGGFKKFITNDANKLICDKFGVRGHFRWVDNEQKTILS